MKNIIAIFSVILSIGQVSALQEAGIEKANTENDKQSQLNALYSKVSEHVKANKAVTQAIVADAKAAYDLAVELKVSNETLSAVGYLYIQTMGREFNQKEKEDVLLRVLEADRGTKYFDKTGLELIKYYVQTDLPFRASGVARELLENRTDKKSKADMMLKIGNEFYFGDLEKSRGYYEDAADIYRELKDPDIAMANFLLGKYYLAKKEYEQAVGLFSTSIEQYTLLPEQQKQSQIAESFLLNAYIKQGNEEQANQLCQKIGRERTWDDGKDIEPLYIVEAKYPRNAAIKGKTAKLRYRFLVDTNGFAKQMELVDYQGSDNYQDSFDKASQEAIEQWRFAPKFEDGKSVESEAYYTLEFKLAK